MAIDEKCQQDQNCDHKIPVAGVVCMRPIYVYGTLVSIPPTYFKLGRGHTYNADAPDLSSDQSHDDEEEDGAASIKEYFQPNSSHNNDTDIEKVSQRKPNCYDSENARNAAKKEAQPYKNPCGWWMQTMDGRDCDDPGFISFSARRLCLDDQDEK